MMKISKEYAGKWVAAKEEKVIASEVSFTKLKKKIANRSDQSEVRFLLVPKGFIVG